MKNPTHGSEQGDSAVMDTHIVWIRAHFHIMQILGSTLLMHICVNSFDTSRYKSN